MMPHVAWNGIFRRIQLSRRAARSMRKYEREVELLRNNDHNRWWAGVRASDIARDANLLFILKGTRNDSYTALCDRLDELKKEAGIKENTEQ